MKHQLYDLDKCFHEYDTQGIWVKSQLNLPETATRAQVEQANLELGKNFGINLN